MLASQFCASRRHSTTSPALSCRSRCRNMRRGLLIFTQRVFDVPVVGAFKLLHVMLWLTAVAFLGGQRAHLGGGRAPMPCV